MAWCLVEGLASGCAHLDLAGGAAGADASGLFGNIHVGVQAGHADARKVVLVTFRFSEDGIEARQVQIAHGSTSRPHADRHDFRLALLDGHRRRLEEYDRWEPRRPAVETQALVQLAAAEYVVRWPVHAEAHEAWVLDRQGTVLTSVPVRPAIERFCREQPRDPDCSGFSTP